MAISKSSTSPYLWHIKRDQSVILGATARSNQQGGESEPTVHPGLHTVEQSPTVHTGFFCCRRGAQWGKVEHSPTVHGGFSCCRAGLPARRAPQPLSLAAVHILTSLICAHWHILFMNTTRLSLRQISSKNITDIKIFFSDRMCSVI